MKATPESLSTLFAALADPTRLRILGLLLEGEICVCHIHETLRIPQPKTSRHLAYLRRVGLVTATKRGLWVHYRLLEASKPIMRALREALAEMDIVAKDGVRLKKTMCCVGPWV